jgi:hypothetical protein
MNVMISTSHHVGVLAINRGIVDEIGAELKMPVRVGEGA